MAFGHRGVNQPVKDLRTEKVVMTTQNHGYTVADTGPLEVTQVNVNDDTVEGLDSEELDVITRQYHPEANPGPHDRSLLRRRGAGAGTIGTARRCRLTPFPAPQLFSFSAIHR